MPFLNSRRSSGLVIVCLTLSVLALFAPSPTLLRAQVEAVPHFDPPPGFEPRNEPGKPREEKSGTDAATLPDREYLRKDLIPGVTVYERKEAGYLGGPHYAEDLQSFAETQFLQLQNSRIDVSRLRMLSFVDNSRTVDYIKDSPQLSEITTDANSYTSDQLFSAVRQSQGKVLFVLAHISDDGSIQTKDRSVRVTDLAAFAGQKQIPILIIGCYSASFLHSGFTTELDSLEIVQRLSTTLERATSYGQLLSGLALPGEAVQLEWSFLIGAGQVLKVIVVNSQGHRRATIYISGFPGMQRVPPSPTGLASISIRSGLPFWIVRGFAFSIVGVLLLWLTALLKPGWLAKIFEAASGCLFLGSLVAAAIILLLIGGTLAVNIGFMGVVVMFLLVGIAGAMLKEVDMPEFIANNPKFFGSLGLIATAFLISVFMP